MIRSTCGVICILLASSLSGAFRSIQTHHQRASSRQGCLRQRRSAPQSAKFVKEQSHGFSIPSMIRSTLDSNSNSNTPGSSTAEEGLLFDMLDQALLLHYRLRHRGTALTDVTLDWLEDQLFSLIGYLAQLVRLRPTDRTLHQSHTDWEGDIEGVALKNEKLLEQSTPEEQAGESLDYLAEHYQQAKQWYAMIDESTLILQLHTVQRQLNSCNELLGSLSSPESPRSSYSYVRSFSSKPRESHNGQTGAVEAISSTSSSLSNRFETSSSSSTALQATRMVDNDELDEDDLDPDLDLLSPAIVPTDNDENDVDDEVVDVAIIGAGIAGLCAGSILNKVYGKNVGIYESHYLPGGCAHAFPRKAASIPNSPTFMFDSGPTILLGCSTPPYNALRQILNVIDESVEWIPYKGWGMIERPNQDTLVRWRVELGPSLFEQGPLQQFGGPQALQEFQALREATKDLLAGIEIPAMAMRPGSKALVPLLRYLPTLWKLISQGELTTGTFAPFMDGPQFVVTDPWLRNWLDALAFSLSGLSASRTAAAAMAFVLYDMHRPGAALDYPKGGMGAIVDALVRGVEAGNNGSKVHLRQHVERINCSDDGSRITGITLRNGKTIRARLGVICNAPVWSLRKLIQDEKILKRVSGNDVLSSEQLVPSSWNVTPEGSSIQPKRQPWDNSDIAKMKTSLLSQCDLAEQTGSFLHLHLALNANGLNLDELEAHYTVMDRGLSGDGSVVNGVVDGPCGELNMIAVSNPCVLDRTLAPEGYIVIHAYGAGNEPYEVWEGLDRKSPEYQRLKEERAQVLWRAVECIIPDTRERTVLELIGSPITHERFLRRPRGTYGSATEDYLRDGSTGIDTLVLANDGVFPGIGVPSVCIAGASAANAFVPVLEQWQWLDTLKRDNKL